jgi:hypothetical protein
MDEKSCRLGPRLLIESYYEHETGKTFVRHPYYEGEWVEHTIFAEALKGVPAPSSSGTETCEVHLMIPHSKQNPQPEPKSVRIKLTNAGTCHMTSGM